MSKTDTKIVVFRSPGDWEKWLEKNHQKSDGIWIRFSKKTAKEKTINHAQALDVALCYGWIDGQAKPHDEHSWLQKFTPRRAKSLWSKRNREHIARLLEDGKMKPAGLKQVEEAKQDGRWEAAYDPPSKSTIPEDFLKALSKNKKAKKFFDTLNKTNLFSIAWRLQTAKKPETREKRMQAILEMLNREEKFH